MADATVLVAEVDGEPAGVFCGARHRARVGGEDRWLLYVHHARILPHYQRMGLGRRSGAALRDAFRHTIVDSQYWYISTNNAKSLGFAREAKNRWSIPVEMVTIDTAVAAGPAHGRPASPEDADSIAAVLNAGHRDEEMFLPHTAASLRERLERAPAQYGWSNVLVGDGAVVGAWPEGRWLAVREAGPDGEHVSRGAAVLDYGCLPGAEDELVRLLRAAAAQVTAEGLNGLSIFTSPGARLRDAVRSLPCTVSELAFWTPSIPEPPGAADRGLYVDHIYF